MALVDINRDPSGRDLRLFGRVGLPGFLLLAAGIAWRTTGSLPLAIGLAAAAVCVAVVGLFRPTAFRGVFVAFQVALFPFAWFGSHAVLAVVYFGVLTPIGLVLRLVRPDPMARRFDRAAPTYWTKREAKSGIERYFRPY